MIKFVNPNTLALHPAAQILPRLGQDSVEFRALRNSIAEAGLQEPLKVARGLVVDGRERHSALIALNYTSVPIIEIPESDVTLCILHTLVARRHYTVSARAYLAFPLIEGSLLAAKERRINILKAGGKEHSTLRVLCSSSTIEELAENIGVSRMTLFSARNIHGHFAKNAALKEHFEPRILSGELGLGAVLQGIAGWESTKGKPRQEREQLLLWEDKLKGFRDPRKWAGWDTAAPEVKDYVRTELRKAIESWPADIRAIVDGI